MSAGRRGPTTEAEALVVAYFEGLFNDGRLDLIEQIVAAAYVEHATAPFETTEPGAVHGPTLMTETLRWLRGQFPDLHFRIEAIVASGDVVVARVNGEGTNLGPMGPIPATGRRFSASSSHWFRIADGRLAEHWATRDDLTTMLQLGLVAGPGRSGSSARPDAGKAAG